MSSDTAGPCGGGCRSRWLSPATPRWTRRNLQEWLPAIDGLAERRGARDRPALRAGGTRRRHRSLPQGLCGFSRTPRRSGSGYRRAGPSGRRDVASADAADRLFTLSVRRWSVALPKEATDLSEVFPRSRAVFVGQWPHTPASSRGLRTGRPGPLVFMSAAGLAGRGLRRSRAEYGKRGASGGRAMSSVASAGTRPLLHRRMLDAPSSDCPAVGGGGFKHRCCSSVSGAAEWRRVVLVCAPAGYGKSGTLSVAQWSDLDPRPSGWVQLGRGDNDPVVLLAHVVAALERTRPGLR